MKYCLLILLVLSTSCCVDILPGGETVKIMSWNVQNLFDATDNGYEYTEFLVSNGSWSDKLYQKRLKNISRIIKLNSPSIVALQEIEGEAVLIDLRDNYLSEYKYIVSTRDDSSIQTGFLSKFPINNVGYIKPYEKDSRLRTMLEVTFDIDGNKLIVINNHWKSKRGGFSEHLRLVSSESLKKRLSFLEDEEVVILGDFNESYDEYKKVHKSYETALMFEVQGRGLLLTDGRVDTGELYTVWPKSNFRGSYVYRGDWLTIDNFLLNSNLMHSGGFTYKSFFVDERAELFNRESIFKWDSNLQSGYSDHLPIVLELETPGIKTSLE